MSPYFRQIKDSTICLFALLFILLWPLFAVLKVFGLTERIGPLLVRYKHWLLRLLNDAK